MITKHQTISQKIEDYILEYVAARNLQPGDRLPPEREIGKKFNVSQIPVRQATQSLVQRGILNRISGKGTIVKSIIKDVLTNRLGIIYNSAESDFFGSTFHTSILKGIEKEANRREKTLVLRPTKRGLHSDPNIAIREIINDVDGLIFIDALPNIFNQIQKTLQLLQKPVVLTNYEDVSRIVDCVFSDNVEGAKKMISFLIGLGHKRIACVSHKGVSLKRDVHPSIRSRIEGYKIALHSHGITVDENLIISLKTVGDSESFMRLMKVNEPPTALFCTGDTTALGIYKITKKLNITIPNDLSVVGYGDIMESSYVSPQLSAVQIPTEEMGVRAVKRLLEIMDEQKIGASTAPLKIVLPADVIQRESQRRIK